MYSRQILVTLLLVKNSTYVISFYQRLLWCVAIRFASHEFGALLQLLYDTRSDSPCPLPGTNKPRKKEPEILGSTANCVKFPSDNKLVTKKGQPNIFSLWLIPLRDQLQFCLLNFFLCGARSNHKQFLAIAFVPFIYQINAWNCIVYLKRALFRRRKKTRRKQFKQSIFRCTRAINGANIFALFKTSTININHKLPPFSSGKPFRLMHIFLLTFPLGLPLKRFFFQL